MVIFFAIYPLLLRRSTQHLIRSILLLALALSRSSLWSLCLHLQSWPLIHPSPLINRFIFTSTQDRTPLTNPHFQQHIDNTLKLRHLPQGSFIMAGFDIQTNTSTLYPDLSSIEIKYLQRLNKTTEQQRQSHASTSSLRQRLLSSAINMMSRSPPPSPNVTSDADSSSTVYPRSTDTEEDGFSFGDSATTLYTDSVELSERETDADSLLVLMGKGGKKRGIVGRAMRRMRRIRRRVCRLFGRGRW